MAGSITVFSDKIVEIENVIQDFALVSFKMGSMFRIKKGRYEGNELQYVMIYFQKNYNEGEDQFIDFSVFSESYQYIENELNIVAKSSHLDGRIALDFSYNYLNLRRDSKIGFQSDRVFGFEDVAKIYSQPFTEGWFCQED